MEKEKKPLPQIFNESAAEARTAFFGKLSNLLVLVTTSDEPVYISPGIADYLSKNVHTLKRLIAREVSRLLDENSRGEADHKYCLPNDLQRNTPLKKIILNGNPSGEFSARYTKKMDIIFTFDHEIGHLVVKNGYPSLSVTRHLAECAADAYAVLRHLQRFGKNTDLFKHQNGASYIIYEASPIHYTDAVVQKVKRISEERDISNLSLRETAELAAKIADEYHLPEKTIVKIHQAFAPVEKFYNDLPQEGVSSADRTRLLKKCFEVMKEHKDDHDIHRAGRLFLSRPDSKSFILDRIEKGDTSWKDALGWIVRHEKQNGIILDPVKAIDAQRPFSIPSSNIAMGR